MNIHSIAVGYGVAGLKYLNSC